MEMSENVPVCVVGCIPPNVNESTEVQTLGAIRIQLYHQCFEQV